MFRSIFNTFGNCVKAARAYSDDHRNGAAPAS